jgi:hypothetical protein
MTMHKNMRGGTAHQEVTQNPPRESVISTNCRRDFVYPTDSVSEREKPYVPVTD